MKTRLLVNENTMGQIDAYLAKKNPGGLILYGEEHLGKSHLAEEIARILLCTSRHGSGACDKCDSCMKALDAHPDYMKVVPDGACIKVEQMREAINFSKYNCVVSCRKVIVIDGAETLSEDAQDIILKLLEDGNDSNVVIFVTSKKLLPTVHSRCSMIQVMHVINENQDNRLSSMLAIGRPGLVKILEEDSAFLDTMKAYITMLSQIKNKREIMEVLGVIKEKDKKNFYEGSSFDEVCVLFNFHENLFETLLNRMYGVQEDVYGLERFMKFDCLMHLYSEETLLNLLALTVEHKELYRNQKYNKNDFFSYLQRVVG